MNNKFNNFITNTEARLNLHLKNGEVKEFSDKLSLFYPNSIKYFTDDTENLLNKNRVPKFMDQFKSISLKMMLDYSSYDVESSKVVLIKKDLTKEEYPLLDISDLLQKVLKLKPDDAGYLLSASYLMQPLNYDFFQLFGVYLSKL